MFIYDLKLEDCKGVGHFLFAIEIPHILCAPLLRPSVPKDKLKGYESMHLSDDLFNNCHVTVDILVALASYWNFMLANQLRKDEGLVAQESVLGWVLFGYWTSTCNKRVSTGLLCVNAVSESVAQILGFRICWGTSYVKSK